MWIASHIINWTDSFCQDAKGQETNVEIEIAGEKVSWHPNLWKQIILGLLCHASYHYHLRKFFLKVWIFLTTFCWPLFEPANQNMGLLKVKMLNCEIQHFKSLNLWTFETSRKLSQFDMQFQTKAIRSFQKDGKKLSKSNKKLS